MGAATSLWSLVGFRVDECLCVVPAGFNSESLVWKKIKYLFLQSNSLNNGSFPNNFVKNTYLACHKKFEILNISIYNAGTYHRDSYNAIE